MAGSSVAIGAVGAAVPGTFLLAIERFLFLLSVIVSIEKLGYRVFFVVDSR